MRGLGDSIEQHEPGIPDARSPVGGVALGFLLGQLLAPARTEAVMSFRRLGASTQRSDRADNGVDILDHPADGRLFSGS